MNLTNARVLLTGATGGIGKAIALLLSKQGASLFLTGRSAQDLELFANSIDNSFGTRPAWRDINLGNPDQIENLASVAIEWDCNIVIHCAGTAGFGAVGDIQIDELYRLMNLNLVAPMILTQQLLPHLLNKAEAQLIFIGSVLGAIGVPGNSAYCASKFGLRGYAEALRREIDPNAIKVKYFGPRATHTDFNTQTVEEFNRMTGTHVDDPLDVADALVEFIHQDTPEKFMGYPEKFALRINGLWPSLLDGSFAKHRAAIKSLHGTLSTER